MIYNGLLDTTIVHFGATEWTAEVGGSIVARKTWTAGNMHAAGRVVTYESGLTYVTIRGAGHMVPSDRPIEASVMIKAWVEGKDLEEYAGGCQRIWLGRGWGD